MPRAPIRHGIRTVLLTALAVPMLLAATDIPRHYPRSYSNIIDAGEREGVVTVFSTTDAHEVQGLLQAFRRVYPKIRVDYRELGSRAIYDNIVAATQRRSATADLVWSSAMDLQIKLVNDGYVQAYASPEKPYLPPWAVWKNEAYGVTAEPVVFAYNSRIVPPGDVPRTHGDFTRLLNSKQHFYTGRVATYDPARSGAGYLNLTQDYGANRELWGLAAALGRNRVKLYDSSRTLLEQVAAGKQVLAYNVLGSYAFELAHRNPAVKVVMPADYTLVVSRIALIPNEARHPNAAKLLLDFLLSRAGQAALARVYMGPARTDIPVPRGTRPADTVARPVRLGPTLLTNLDQIKRRRFLQRWQEALQGK